MGLAFLKQLYASAELVFPLLCRVDIDIELLGECFEKCELSFHQLYHNVFDLLLSSRQRHLDAKNNLSSLDCVVFSLLQYFSHRPHVIQMIHQLL